MKFNNFDGKQFYSMYFRSYCTFSTNLYDDEIDDYDYTFKSRNMKIYQNMYHCYLKNQCQCYFDMFKIFDVNTIFEVLYVFI